MRTIEELKLGNDNNYFNEGGRGRRDSSNDAFSFSSFIGLIGFFFFLEQK